MFSRCPPQGVDAQRLALLRYVLKACRAEARVGDLFSDRSMSSRFASLAKQHLKVGGFGGAGGCGSDSVAHLCLHSACRHVPTACAYSALQRFCMSVH